MAREAEEHCTLQKHGNVYLLTITGTDQHRLNPSLINSLRSLLRPLLSLPPSSPPSALVTTAHGRFFSNGYDLDWAGSDPDSIRLMSSSLRSLVRDLLSLPMPTIAAVNGHAAAAGMILALSHDYVVMNSRRGFLYMSEVDIGLVLPRWFVAIVRGKVGGGGGRAVRELLMRARKVTAAEAVGMGLVEEGCEGPERTAGRAMEIGEELVGRGWAGDVVRANRLVVWADLVHPLDEDETVADMKPKPYNEAHPRPKL
ncbi:hypothetical protein MLD38_035952 [Melastoma candidum]|uniref:Uncharacterized protein n=1 Tax=Melastoma candidum TaxID=119954 RepID=A0ACB9LK24_9MYRT|nr:hypothetical protein MLD38_035952 [Melastoma candidum]